MFHLLIILIPDPKRNIDIYKFIIIINPGYHPADIIIILIHLQKINIIEGRKFFNYYKKTAITTPYLFKIGGRKNNLLFTFSICGNINNK